MKTISFFGSLAFHAGLWTAFAAGASAQSAGSAQSTSCGNLPCNQSVVTENGYLIVGGFEFAGNRFTNDSWAHLITSSSKRSQNPAGPSPSSAVSFRPASSAANNTLAFKPADSAANSSITFRPAVSTPTSTSCDVNGDGQVNVVDVQLITNMEIGATGFACTANVGGVLGCTDSARQVVIKAALGQGCHFVSLSWSPSPSSGVVGYNVYRGASPNGESSTPVNTGGPVTGTSYQDTTTVSGITYYYVVRATNGSIESPPSNESLVTAQ